MKQVKSGIHGCMESTVNKIFHQAHLGVKGWLQSVIICLNYCSIDNGAKDDT